MTTVSPGTPQPLTSLAPTGIPGLDAILKGGFPRDRVYLIDGDPGTGKTTLALQFLMEGARHGESVLYVTLSETIRELRAVAGSHGWSLDGVTLHELTPIDGSVVENQYTVFHPSEVELGETTKAIVDTIQRLQPSRVVFDSLSEMRLLARDPLKYRRQILALKQLFVARGGTVLLLDDGTAGDEEGQLHSIANGVVCLEQVVPEYGPARRRLRVLKLRGVPFLAGNHDLAIRTGGLEIYPRAVPEAGPGEPRSVALSNVEQLDALFGGGLDHGTTVLFLGPAGVGKSALGGQYAAAAARRGERVSIFLFDESEETYRWRSAGIGCAIDELVASGNLALTNVNPGDLSPGAFTHLVRNAVESGARTIVLDSLNGYLNAMPEERFLLLQLHELFMYLRHKGVLTLVTLAQHGMIGHMPTPIDVSYLADTVVLLRYFESAGSIRQAISVMKKRTGRHERTIRELRLDSQGVRVGDPLVDFQGVLTGVPTYTGTGKPLLRPRE